MEEIAFYGELDPEDLLTETYKWKEKVQNEY